MANSMSKNERIFEAVYCAVDEVNRQISSDRQINKSENTELLGESALLESVEVVSLIVAIEQEIEYTFQKEISLTDNDDLMVEENGPMHTIKTLVHHISNLLGE